MKRLLLILVVVLLYTPLVFGLPGVKTWKATWVPNTEIDLAGYYLYWKGGVLPFDDSERVDCGLVTEYNLDSIPFRSIIALTAYDTSGNEGGFSSEVPFDKDNIPPAAPGGFSIVEQ